MIRVGATVVLGGVDFSMGGRRPSGRVRSSSTNGSTEVEWHDGTTTTVRTDTLWTDDTYYRR